jgi:hypothetical protein
MMVSASLSDVQSCRSNLQLALALEWMNVPRLPWWSRIG